MSHHDIVGEAYNDSTGLPYEYGQTETYHSLMITKIQ